MIISHTAVVHTNVAMNLSQAACSCLKIGRACMITAGKDTAVAYTKGLNIHLYTKIPAENPGRFFFAIMRILQPHIQDFISIST